MDATDPKRPSRSETGLSTVILVMLGIIGITLYVGHYDDNPALLQADLQAELATPLPDTRSTTAIPLLAPPPGVEPFTPAERFDPQTLSDKINGKAELYLSAGFRQLQSQRFRYQDGSDDWVEVFIYDMGKVQNAFAVFSAQRRDDAIALDILPHAYRTPNAIFMVHGPYYLEIISAKPGEQALAALRLISEAFIQQTPVKTQSMAETDFFPPAALLPDSITLIATDAFGFDQLDQVFVAEYQIAASRMVAFVAKRSTLQEAQLLARKYADFLTSFGGQTQGHSNRDPSFRVIEIMDSYEVIFAQDVYLAGIHEADDLQTAVDLAVRLQQHLKKVD